MTINQSSIKEIALPLKRIANPLLWSLKDDRTTEKSGRKGQSKTDTTTLEKNGIRGNLPKTKTV